MANAHSKPEPVSKETRLAAEERLPGGNEVALIEQRALRVSSAGALVLAVMGIGFAIHSGSEAILLDGLFSALGFFMALMTLYVSRLVRRPDDDRFQYGYAHFAPLINVLKSLVMSVLCVFALLAAISTLLAGGQPMAVGSALVYALGATLLGAGLWLYLRAAARRCGSTLVSLDARAARMDMLLSAAVLASFALGWFSQGTGFERHLDYLDPMVVAVLCLISLPIPLRILWINGREALLLAPEPAVQESVIGRIESALEGFPVADHRIRMVKLGKVLGVTLHLQPADDVLLQGIAELDHIRRDIEAALVSIELEVGIDIIFTGDMTLAR